MENLEKGKIYQVTTKKGNTTVGRYAGESNTSQTNYHQFNACYDLSQNAYLNSFYLDTDLVHIIARPTREQVEMLINYELDNNIEP